MSEYHQARNAHVRVLIRLRLQRGHTLFPDEAAAIAWAITRLAGLPEHWVATELPRDDCSAINRYTDHLHSCALLRDADSASVTYGRCTCGLFALRERFGIKLINIFGEEISSKKIFRCSHGIGFIACNECHAVSTKDKTL